MKKILSLICALSVVMAMCAFSAGMAEAVTFAGGSGTAEDPWQIETPQQLDAVRNDLAASYQLTANIDLSAYENWEPLGYFDMAAEDEAGYYANGFTGRFDGNGFTVSNITASSDEGVGVGLFGLVSADGVVFNLTVENASVSGYMAVGAIIGYHCGSANGLTLKGENAIAAYNCAGGIAGGSEYGSIENCVVENAAITILGDNDFSNGQIIQNDMAQCGGLIVGGGFGGHVANCAAIGEISALGVEPIGLGGIGGCLEYMDYVTDCTTNVTITAPNNAHAVGGICGYSGTVDTENPTRIENCTANFNMTLNGATHVGGIVGTGLYIYGMESMFSIESCSANGEITGAVTPGSVVGRAEGSSYEDCTLAVTLDGAALESEIGATDRMYESADQ